SEGESVEQGQIAARLGHELLDARHVVAVPGIEQVVYAQREAVQSSATLEANAGTEIGEGVCRRRRLEVTDPILLEGAARARAHEPRRRFVPYADASVGRRYEWRVLRRRHQDGVARLEHRDVGALVGELGLHDRSDRLH